MKFFCVQRKQNVIARILAKAEFYLLTKSVYPSASRIYPVCINLPHLKEKVDECPTTDTETQGVNFLLLKVEMTTFPTALESSSQAIASNPLRKNTLLFKFMLPIPW